MQLKCKFFRATFEQNGLFKLKKRLEKAQNRVEIAIFGLDIRKSNAMACQALL